MMGALEGDLVAILTGIGMVLALIFTVIWYIVRRKRGLGPGGMDSRARDLQSLERKAALTPEEKKKIREAMARQYLAEQQAKVEAAQMPKSVRDLRIEAEKLDLELERKRQEEEAKAPKVPATPPEPNPASQLPEHLRPLAGKSSQELEDLRNAGFVSDEDYELVRGLAANTRQPQQGMK